jgi:hypothetical protein
MRSKHLSFSQVLDVYGFRVVVDTVPNCYVALGTLHGLYKPMPGKFKDYIAIRKINGYQSLHTTLIGPYGTPVEFQIRTQEMHRTAESGVAAHWLYKTGDQNMSDLQQRTHAWLQSLLDIQQQTGDSAEFLEHVKVDLFPDSVYVFTPKSKIIALPRGATPLDFAYSIHTGIGDHTVSVKINHEPSRCAPSCTTATSSRSRPTRFAPEPDLAELCPHRQGALGDPPLPAHHQPERIGGAGPGTAGPGAGPAGHQGRTAAVDDRKLLAESSAKSMDELYADIGIGKRMPALVARHIFGLMDGDVDTVPRRRAMAAELDPVTIYGSEGVSVQLAPCCLPIPGDQIIGQLRRDQGLVVHTGDCSQAKRLRVQGTGPLDPGPVGQRAEPPLRLPHPPADQQRKGHPRPRRRRDRRVRRQHHLCRHGRGRRTHDDPAALHDPGEGPRAPGAPDPQPATRVAGVNRVERERAHAPAQASTISAGVRTPARSACMKARQRGPGPAGVAFQVAQRMRRQRSRRRLYSTAPPSCEPSMT